MRLGVNDNVNVDIKQIGIPKHNFVPRKIKLPHAIETESKKKNMKRKILMLAHISQKLLV